MGAAPIRILAALHVALGGLGLMLGAVFSVTAAGDANGGEALRYGLPLFLMLSGVYFLPAFIGGLGLWFGKGWGRMVIAILSMLLLLAIPVGTVIGGFGLWALAKAPSAQTPVAAGAPPPAPRAPPGPSLRARLGTVLAIAWVGSGFVVLLGGGFRLAGDPAPSFLDRGFYPAIGVFVGATAFAIGKWRPAMSAPPPLNPLALVRQRADLRREREALAEQHRQRLATLEADPSRREFAARIRAGEAWSDAQIAYRQDPAARATCECLKPTEAALRQAGIDVRLAVDANVIAPVRVNEPAWRAAFQPPESVIYAEFYYGGRHAEDDPAAFLRCNQHNAAIETLHPAAAGPDAAWLPEAP